MVSGIAVAGAMFASRQELYGTFGPALRDAYLLGDLFTACSVFLSIPIKRKYDLDIEQYLFAVNRLY